MNIQLKERFRYKYDLCINKPGTMTLIQSYNNMILSGIGFYMLIRRDYYKDGDFGAKDYTPSMKDKQAWSDFLNDNQIH
jgi:hypothetical protein